MIRDRNGGEADALGLADDIGWSTRPVGCGRMNVEVDERAGAVAAWT